MYEPVGQVILPLSLIIGCLLIYGFVIVYRMRRQHMQQVHSLTLIPHPDRTNHDVLGALYHSLAEQPRYRSLTARLCVCPTIIHVELISSPTGLTYQLIVPTWQVASLKALIRSLDPSLIIEDHEVLPPAQPYRTIAFRLRQSFLLPLAVHNSSASFTSLVSELAKHRSLDPVAVRLSLSPLPHHVQHRFVSHLITGRLRPPHATSYVLQGVRVLWRFGTFCIHTAFDILTLHPGAIIRRGQRQIRLTPREQQQFDQSLHKLQQPLLYTSVQLRSPRPLPPSLIHAVSAHSRHQRQSLVRAHTFTHPPRLILSSQELSSFIPLPHSHGVHPHLTHSLTTTLPQPVSMLASAASESVEIGKSLEGPVRLSLSERERHCYIIGGTGNGKTTLLLHSIHQDIDAGRGVGIIDPHGDLSLDVLRIIPHNRREDVVYINPDDLAHPIALNVLECDPSLTGDDRMREHDRITEAVVSLFRKLFSSDDSGGHRVEYILRNCIQTALTLPDPTLFTMYDLLNNASFRLQTVHGLQDERLKLFWQSEFGRAGGMQQVKMAAGITAKIGRFLFSASAKRMLEQPHSSIDIDTLMNQQKIILCNASKGLLGEDTAELLGSLVLVKLQLAALRRARLPAADRVPFYVYVDEFQTFATPSFAQLLSESRKYKLSLMMAQQTTAQHADDYLLQTILANVGTMISFRTGSPLDETRILPFFQPYLGPTDLMNVPPYMFYAKLAALRPQPPVSAHTIQEEPLKEDYTDECIALSRSQYATTPPEPLTATPAVPAASKSISIPQNEPR